MPYYRKLRLIKLTQILKIRVNVCYSYVNVNFRNFRDVNYRYFSPKSVTNLNPRHAKLMKELYECLGTEKGKSMNFSRWRSSGYMDTVKIARSGRFLPLTHAFRDNCTIITLFVE